MSTSTTPTIPPRPSKSPDKESSAVNSPSLGSSNSSAVPKIPPRPLRNKRIESSASPNSDSFAPSPIGDEFLKNTLKPESVEMPSIGEEGKEYSIVAEKLENEKEQKEKDKEKESDALDVSSPEQTQQTRSVAQDLKLHAPKPSLPASSAKQRVMTVTRTDSESAASFGIGKSSKHERSASRDSTTQRSSTAASVGSDQGHQTYKERGILEIGQRVPMLPQAGDVQAPTPSILDATRNHSSHNKSSHGVPPGSYGLHGHGVKPNDKLEKAYYEKHPEVLEREERTPINGGRPEYAMSPADLNKMVRETAARAAALNPENVGTPTEEAAWAATDEYVNRMNSPKHRSQVQHAHTVNLESTLQASFNKPGRESGSREGSKEWDFGVIHVDDPKHSEYRSYGNLEAPADDADEYTAPILAEDQIDKGQVHQRPAIYPRHTSYEGDAGPIKPASRPKSVQRPESHISPPEIISTPLEDVEEYEPPFPKTDAKEKENVNLEKTTSGAATSKSPGMQAHRFPSKDIWEEAPASSQYTTTVTIPDLPEEEHYKFRHRTAERVMTPVQIFAQQQDLLAEQEYKKRIHGHSFLRLSEETPEPKEPTEADDKPHANSEKPSIGHRFPSRDVWEEAPESHLLKTTVSVPQEEEEEKPDIPRRPTKKLSGSSEPPAIPTRPKPKELSGEERTRPAISEKPKPHIPARPIKDKPKPPVPSRPIGKIAALQAGFMSDLNKRLQLGSQAPKKEEAQPEETPEEVKKEKVPLSDARKGRARGPQRRAPAKITPTVPIAQTVDEKKPLAEGLSVTTTQFVWSIDPDHGLLKVLSDERKTGTPVAKETSLHSMKDIASLASDKEIDKGEEPTSKAINLVAAGAETGADLKSAVEPEDEPDSNVGPKDALESKAVDKSVQCQTEETKLQTEQEVEPKKSEDTTESSEEIKKVDEVVDAEEETEKSAESVQPIKDQELKESDIPSIEGAEKVVDEEEKREESKPVKSNTEEENVVKVVEKKDEEMSEDKKGEEDLNAGEKF